MQMMPLAYSTQMLCYLNDPQNSILTQNRKSNVHVVSCCLEQDHFTGLSGTCSNTPACQHPL